MLNTNAVSVIGFLKVYDPITGEVFVEKNNAINYENMSVALANSLANRGTGMIYQMAFGNGGASVDSTGIITYLPTNVNGTSASLYNQTYVKVVDDNSVFNTAPTDNKLTVTHTSLKLYSDILIQCLLAYGEPAGQDAFDNGTQTSSSYIFNELGIMAYYGTNSDGSVNTKLLTHVIFHPVQKSLNRQIQVDYTIRIQSLTNLVTS